MAEGADALVVGGGPAGLATAIAARQAGLEHVVVLDGRRPPVDKACGEGLMPDGLKRLEALGVEVDRRRAAAFKGIRYVDGATVARGEFPAGVVGLGVRRLVLHLALVQRAEAVGVELHWGVAARRLIHPGASGAPAAVETDAGTWTGRFLVAADGLNSRLRRWLGAGGGPPAARGAGNRYGVRRHYGLPPWTDEVEVHWGEGAEAYVTPVGPEEVGVAMLWSGGPARFDELLARFPALAERLAAAPPTSRDRGAGPLLQPVPRVVVGRTALVGDASGYVDALTGEGLSLAFHQATALAAALAAEDLPAYARAHRAIGRLPTAVTRLMLFIERRPALRRRVVRALAADPELFGRLLAVHCRAVPLSRVGLAGALRLAWQLAAA